MKLSKHAFTRFWDVHAWVGVLGGLVLHVMFFAGAFSLFYEELSFWQERGTMGAPAPGLQIAPLVEKTLRDRGVQPTELAVFLPGEHRAFLEISWPDKAKPDWEEVRLDSRTGAVVSETSRLGRILYYLHFLYHPQAPWGMYVAGAFAVVLLLALVTGVLIHLKDIVRQFHQFRPGNTAKVLWSDMHKVLGVMGLPFQVMFAFTGALLCLVSLLLVAFAAPVFGGDEAAATASLWGGGREVKATGRPATMLGLDRLIEHAGRAVPGFQPTFVRMSRIGDEGATARLSGALPGILFARGQVVLRATDGTLVSESLASGPTPGVTLIRWVTGLHYALFGGLAAKVLYALLAAATCLTILTGNWIWLLRRAARSASLGNRLLAQLTIGVGGGVVVGTAALFWANRVAPPSVRLAAEAWAFFGVWGFTAVLFLARAESRTGWVGLLRVSGFAFALLPAASALGSDAHLFNVGQHGRLDVLGVEVGLALLGLGLLVAASLVEKRVRAAETLERRILVGVQESSRQGA